jgi:hypothetical protein
MQRRRRIRRRRKRIRRIKASRYKDTICIYLKESFEKFISWCKDMGVLTGRRLASAP